MNPRRKKKKLAKKKSFLNPPKKSGQIESAARFCPKRKRLPYLLQLQLLRIRGAELQRTLRPLPSADRGCFSLPGNAAGDLSCCGSRPAAMGGECAAAQPG